MARRTGARPRTTSTSPQRIRTGEHPLIINHTFLPCRGVGGRRLAKFTKELARRCIVHVVHNTSNDDLKGSVWTDDIAHPITRKHPLPQRPLRPVQPAAYLPPREGDYRVLATITDRLLADVLR